jgi:hypothetical protein
MPLVTPDLVSWQFQGYPLAHGDRTNLVIHALTQPLFVSGALWIPTALAVHAGWSALAGLGAMVVAVAAQGRGHKMERNPPAPFASPLDLLARLLVEQFFNFPRFVLTGGFGRAWRAAGER